MSKKKVTAPLTYDPGKGRPKEHLAYLNWQEMQALKQINGNNQERGPKGLPSFPPADAIGSSSRSTSTKSSGMKSGPGSTGGKKTPSGGGYKAPSGGSKSGPGSTGGAKTPSRGVGFGGGGGKGAPSVKTPGMNARDAQFKQIAESTKASAALKKAPSVASDFAKGGIRTLNVGPMGAPVKVAAGQEGKQIKGAISDIAKQAYVPSRAALGAVTRGPGSVSGMIPGNRDPLAQTRSLQGITNSLNDMLGTSYTPAQVSKLTRAIAGEAAGEDDFGRAAVANTMINRIQLAQQDPKKYGYMGGTSVNKLLGQYDAAGMRRGTTENRVYKTSQPGTKTYQDALRALNEATNPDSTFSKTASPRVLNATHYYNPETSNPKWGQKRSGREFETVGRHVFGTAEPIEGAVATARAQGLGLPSINREAGTVTPTGAESTASPTVSAGIMNLVPDSLKIDYMQREAVKLGKALPGMIADKTRDFFGAGSQPATAEAGTPVKPGTKMFTLEQGDIYGPKPVSPEAQKEMAQQEKRNKYGTRAMKSAPLIGRIAAGADALRKLFTGKNTAEATADLKRAYMQASPTQQAELEKQYPNLTKFAADAGLEPKLPMANYTAWAERSGLTSPGESSRGGDMPAGGIADISSTAGTGAQVPSTPAVASTAGSRPYIYYEWDLGINVPSPGDKNYTEYQKYLSERASAQAAFYGTG